MFNKLILAMLLTFFANAAVAADASVTISDAYAQPSAGKVGVAFFTATSTTNDAITGVMP